jgi:hypothetical protein
MKVLQQFGMQGDTQWYAIDSIPREATKLDKQFIAKSEQSGSVHALFGNYDMYEIDGGFVMDCKEDCVLNHTLVSLIDEKLDVPKILPKKDHRHSIIGKGLYVVGIQNRFDPLLNLKQKVKD